MTDMSTEDDPHDRPPSSMVLFLAIIQAACAIHIAYTVFCRTAP